MASIISSGTTSGTALNFSGDTSGVLQLATNGTTTALSISTAQVVTLTNALPVTSGGTGVTTSTGTGAVVLGTSPTIATPTMTGQATIPTINLTGGQITFPATQSASTNANTLDDYEEGTWTPTIIPSTGTVTSQTCSGSYVKIGKLVYVTFSIKPDTGTISDIDHIDGLPYATASISPAGFGSARSNATGNMWFTRTISSDSSIYLAQYNNTNSLSAGQTIIGAIAYIAAT